MANEQIWVRQAYPKPDCESCGNFKAVNEGRQAVCHVKTGMLYHKRRDCTAPNVGNDSEAGLDNYSVALFVRKLRAYHYHLDLSSY